VFLHQLLGRVTRFSFVHCLSAIYVCGLFLIFIIKNHALLSVVTLLHYWLLLRSTHDVTKSSLTELLTF
jgi:hypothetical protein